MLRRDDLDGLDRPALRAAWEDDIGRPPPQRASENYMRSVLAYRIQERAGPRLSKARTHCPLVGERRNAQGHTAAESRNQTHSGMERRHA